MRSTVKHQHTRPFVLALMSLTLVAAACGSAGDGATGDDLTLSETETTTTETTEVDTAEIDDGFDEPSAESGCEGLEDLESGPRPGPDWGNHHPVTVIRVAEIIHRADNRDAVLAVEAEDPI